MPILELKLAEQHRSLKLGDPIKGIDPFIFGSKGTLKIDTGLGDIRHDFTFENLGINLVFKSEKLSSIYLYLSPVAKYKKYSGTCSYLEEFWKDPNPDKFVQSLELQNYKLREQKNVKVIDMLSEELRIRLSMRPEQNYILIDDGSRIRNK